MNAMTDGDWSNQESRKGGKRCSSVWNPFNIGMMVLGFVFFWPIGLVFLFWMLNGNHIADLPGAIRNKFRGFKNGESHSKRWSGSGNQVFDEYQQTQLDRIDEIKTEVRNRASRFTEYKSAEVRKQEQAEFDRFMHRGSTDE